MEYIPIKTRTLWPPKDDLFAVLDEYLTDVQEKDVLLISSKVVAIGEGRCVLQEEFDKEKHIKAEAQLIIPREYWRSPLTMVNNVFVSGAGVDLSNSDRYYTLLPKDPFASAKQIYEYVVKRFGCSAVGVIITDSRSEPCRFGAVGVGIGFWGIKPLEEHSGKKDLFGRKIKHSKSNVIDCLAAGATLVMGEVSESTPIVVARSVPALSFADGNHKEELYCPIEEDTFRVLYKKWL